eukprot:TRINITY_DN17542_c0_g1_i11.p1 TRINITY_DN17542_c0_g1~~TRINITY_DN17542_c0_g1_i11.p1  ORF type:complete len:220 (+),score=98.60 TRINITY_DN17542_c0_g1_i11:1157-1816(+)
MSSSIKVIYFDMAGRVEPTRLCLTLGGVPFEDEILTWESWGAMKPTVAPRHMPLMELDGELISQSVAMARWAAKISKYEGRPLYPEDPLEALRVDEVGDMIQDVFLPMVKSYSLPEDEREKFCVAAVSEGGDVHKWLVHIDSILGRSTSGFAVGDHLTLADISIFTGVNMFASGHFDLISKDCLAPFKNIAQHREKIANIPEVKARYADKEGVFSVYKA